MTDLTTAGRQSSSPASAQGRWTSSLCHRVPPEPAGHAAPQCHLGQSEQPTSEPGTCPTEHHWEPGEVMTERGFKQHCRPLMDHWILSLVAPCSSLTCFLDIPPPPLHLTWPAFLHHALPFVRRSARVWFLWSLSFVLMSLCVSLPPNRWCCHSPAVPVMTGPEPSNSTSSWTAGLQSWQRFKSQWPADHIYSRCICTNLKEEEWMY